MLMCQQSSLVEVRRSNNRGRGGRGVFARDRIEAGTLIERVPVLLIPHNQVFGDPPEGQRSARISWYVFDWSEMTKRHYVGLALGYGSIYNHSYEPNAKYARVVPDLLEFYAIRVIEAGEEVLINYNGEAGGKGEVAFEMH